MLNVDIASSPVSPRAAGTSRSLTLGVGDGRVRVEGLPPALRQRLGALVAPFVTRATPTPARAARIHVAELPGADGWRVTCEGEAPRSFSGPDALLKYLEWLALTQALSAMTNYIAFHAAALTRESSTVVLVGKSGEGKTTLTLGLMARGWLPLADDIVLVDPATLALRPFPRCFHLDEGTQAMFADRVPLEWPGNLEGYARTTNWAPGGQAATTILIVNRCPTCMAARLPLMQAEGAGALLAEAAGTRVTTSQVASTAARIAAGAACYRLKNGPLESSLNLIERACES